MNALDQLHPVEMRHLKVGQQNAVIVLTEGVKGGLTVRHGIDRKLLPFLK